MTCQTREYEEIPFATFVNILHFTYIKYYSGQWVFFCFCFLFDSITLLYLPALLAGLITLENIILCKIVFI